MEAALREALAPYEGDDGSIRVSSSTWIATARNPG
jgi:hypothetical protein